MAAHAERSGVRLPKGDALRINEASAFRIVNYGGDGVVMCVLRKLGTPSNVGSTPTASTGSKNIQLILEKGITMTTSRVKGCVVKNSNGVNPYQASFLEVENVFELKRMCRSEPKREEFPLTQFISKTLKLLQKDYKVDCVVAFADPEHGHEGGVYRAANFAKHGETQAEYHLIDKDGNIRHRRYAYRHSQRNGISIAESREILGVKRIKTLPKIRYVRYFGKFKYRNLN